MNREWEEFRLAGSFLTIFPVGQGLDTSPERLGRSMAFFPAIGLALGLGLVVLDWVLAAFMPRAVLDCLLLLVLIAVTGAIHLDGVADLFDGLAGGKDREGVLRIMKDSRVGAIGVVGLVMVLLLKYLSLYHVPPATKSAALIFMPAAGRWVQVLLASVSPYLRPEGGTGSAFVEQVAGRELVIASGTLAVAGLVLLGLPGVLLVGLVGLAGVLFWRYFLRRLGGVSGDVLGAATEMMEVLALLFILALS